MADEVDELTAKHALRVLKEDLSRLEQSVEGKFSQYYEQINHGNTILQDYRNFKAAIDPVIRRVQHILEGNGKQGLLERLVQMEDKILALDKRLTIAESTLTWAMRGLMGGLLGMVVLLMLQYGKNLH